ncbi:hypothetical protein ACQKML_17895 [Peribacillus frigoritolerans]
MGVTEALFIQLMRELIVSTENNKVITVMDRDEDFHEINGTIIIDK